MNTANSAILLFLLTWRLTKEARQITGEAEIAICSSRLTEGANIPTNGIVPFA
jgi:hypothetical protein